MGARLMLQVSPLSPQLASAQSLAAQSYPVFPVWWIEGSVCACRASGACKPGFGSHVDCTPQACKVCHPGKHPITPKGLHDATTEIAKVQQFWTIAPKANVGVALPDGVLVVDIDPRNGGEASFERLATERGFPQTRRVATGGGGLHLWFRVPAGLSFPKNLDDFGCGKGVDLKQFGGYVLAPPSNHESGRSYAWVDPGLVADAPTWLLELGRPRDAGGHAVIDDEEGALLPPGEIERMAALIGPLFENGKKHQLAFALGGWLRRRGWNSADVRALVSQLPSKSPAARVKDALDGFRARKDHGWSVIKQLCGEAPAAALDGAAPNPRRARELTERAAAVEVVAAMAANAMPLQVYQPPQVPGIVNGAVLPLEPMAPSAPPNGPKASSKQVTTADVVNMLAGGEWSGVLGFDLLANRVMCLREPPMRPVDNPGVPVAGEWTDAHSSRARTWLTDSIGREPSKEAMDCAVEIVGRRHAYHPVQTYLVGLRWDGVPRIDGLLSRYFGADASEYTQRVGAKTLIAAVARATQPGCKVDTMLILEGVQGIGKSRAVRALAGDDWFADTPLDLESKDAAQCLQGKWLYEIGELHSFNRSETTRIKAFVSSQADNLRPSYGRRNQDFPRQCIFLGTTNGTEYLSDTTGNRRYWPVRCTRIDIAALVADRDQLWAEAAARYAAGEKWWLEGAETSLAEAQQVDREAIDPWEAQIVAWMEQQLALGVARPAFRGFGMADILTGALHLGVSEQSQATATRVGKLLARLGWRSRQVRDPATHKAVRLYAQVAA